MCFSAALARWWHPIYGFTAFLQFDEAHEATGIAAFREYPVFPYRGYAPYDGLQYSQMAYHPLLEAVELRTAVDSLAYRARRILLPAAAWLLSAGQPAWIAQVYAGLNIACWLLLAAVFWKKLPVTDTRGAIAWIGLLFSAGVMGSVRLALIDLPALLLVALSLWDAERQRNSRSAGWLAAASLTRETSILAAVAFFDWPPKTRASLLRGLLWTLLAAAPLVLWLAYVRWRLGNVEAGSGNFTWPLVALLGKWRHCLGAMGDPANQPVRMEDPARHGGSYLPGGFHPDLAPAGGPMVARWARCSPRCWSALAPPSGMAIPAQPPGCCCRSISPATCSPCARGRRSAGCWHAISRFSMACMCSVHLFPIVIWPPPATVRRRLLLSPAPAGSTTNTMLIIGGSGPNPMAGWTFTHGPGPRASRCG